MANTDSYSVAEGGTLTTTDPLGTVTPGNSADNGVLANDTDTSSDPLTAILVSGPTRGTLTLNANGTFSGSFTLANDTGTGYYQLGTRLPLQCKEEVDPSKSNDPVCRDFQVPFQVAAYRKPEFEVSMTTPRTDYKQGDTAAATIDAKYFFGGKAENARVEWSIMSRPYVFDRFCA